MDVVLAPDTAVPPVFAAEGSLEAKVEEWRALGPGTDMEPQGYGGGRPVGVPPGRGYSEHVDAGGALYLPEVRRLWDDAEVFSGLREFRGRFRRGMARATHLPAILGPRGGGAVVPPLRKEGF